MLLGTARIWLSQNNSLVRNAASDVNMDCGVVGTTAAGIVNSTVASISQRLFLVSGAEAINPQQYKQAYSLFFPRAHQPSDPSFQVCLELSDTKSRLEKATEDLMSSKAAYSALEDQVVAFPVYLVPIEVADSACSCKKRRKRPKAAVCWCWAATKSQPSCRRL